MLISSADVRYRIYPFIVYLHLRSEVKIMIYHSHFSFFSFPMDGASAAIAYAKNVHKQRIEKVWMSVLFYINIVFKEIRTLPITLNPVVESIDKHNIQNSFTIKCRCVCVFNVNCYTQCTAAECSIGWPPFRHYCWSVRRLPFQTSQDQVGVKG